MVSIENELSKYSGLTARGIRKLDIDFYNQLVAYSKSIQCAPLDLLMVFKTHKSLSNMSSCVTCGSTFNPYLRNGITCSKSCQSLYMHKIRTIDVSDRRRARAKITNDRKRASGELTEIAKRAYRTRRSNYSEADINNQYKRIGEINSEIAKKRNFDARINTIDRIAAILTRKSPLLILRMFYVNGGVKIYGVLIDELVELGFLVFENFRNKKFRYAARNGFKFLHGCAECGEPCNIRHKFCSYVCKDRNLELNENKSVVMKIYYSVQENKQKTGDIGN